MAAEIFGTILFDGSNTGWQTIAQGEAGFDTSVVLNVHTFAQANSVIQVGLCRNPMSIEPDFSERFCQINLSDFGNRTLPAITLPPNVRLMVKCEDTNTSAQAYGYRDPVIN